MSNLIKISPSLLEQYRVVLNGEYNRTAADLKEYILGDYKKNIHTSRGDAWHAMLEHGPMQYAYIDGQPLATTKYRDKAASQWPFESLVYKVHEPELNQTWEFSAECVQPIHNYLEAHPNIIHEAWHTHWVKCEGFKIRVRMKYDGLEGIQAEEFKTTSRAKKYGDYEKSVQWKMYLLANPQLTAINYNVFVLNKNNTKCKYERFTYLPGPEVETEVMELMSGLVNWIKGKPELLNRLKITEDKSPWAKV